MKQVLERALGSSVVAILLLAAPSAAGRVPIVTTIGEVLPSATLIEGMEAGDALGGAVLELGDVDGDGLEDLAFVARHRSGRDHDARILLGFRWLEEKLDLSAWASWGVELRSRDRFPFPNAALGDLDGDGFADMGFQSVSATSPAVILFGGRLGTGLPAVIDADSFSGCRTAKVHPDPALDPAALPSPPMVLGSGDFDGDGDLDLVVSTHTQPDPAFPLIGLVYIVHGSHPFPSDIILAEIGTFPGSRIRASGQADDPMKTSPCFGSRFAAADFDGDGKDDLVLSTPNLAFERDGTTRHSSAVLVLFGRGSWPPDLDAADPATPGICRLVPSSEESILADAILEVPGDMTGDGVPDLLVSKIGDEPGCHLVSGARLAPGLLVLEDVAATFFTSEDGHIEKIAGLGDWDGDGRRELAFGFPLSGYGGVTVVPVSDPLPARVSVDASLPGCLEIIGTEPNVLFGQEVEALDLDGDGRRELVAAAPGFNFPAQPELQIKGRLIVLHGESDYLGPLEGTAFSPKLSSLRGDGRLRISGRGFDERTEVHLGDVALDAIERPDSRTIAARIPPRDMAGTFPVRLVRGTDGFQFADPFTYFEGVFPAEVDVHDIGDGWCTIMCPAALKDDAGGVYEGEPYFDPHSHRTRGGHDFTGDGLGDLVFAYHATGPKYSGKYPLPEMFFILPGSQDLPRELRSDAIEDRAAIIGSEVPFDFGGWQSFQTEILVGDMTGDGRSELAVGAATSAAVYLIFGHEIAAGPTTVQELLRNGKGCRIEGLPRRGDESYLYLVEAKDVNGDGLQDLGIVNDYIPLEVDGSTVNAGCLSLVLGRREFPPVLGFADLPKVYGKLPLSTGTIATIKELTDGVGDVDGDGFDDIAIQCYSAGDLEEGGFGAFKAWFILFGRVSWPASMVLDRELETPGACELVRMYWGDWNPSSPGGGVAGIGDEDRDGKDDLGVIISLNNQLGIPSRDFRLLHGRSRDDLDYPRDPRKPEDFDAVFPAGPDINDLGIRDGGRDFNGDGFPDVLLGDPHPSRLPPPPSRAIVLFGGNLEDRASTIEAVKGKLEVLNRGECPEDQGACSYPYGFYFGGDINGDRREELVIASDLRIWIYFNPLGPIDPSRHFRRGDSNSDGAFDLSDAVGALGFLFLGSEEPACMAAADVDDDGKVDITDPIRLLGWLYLGSEPPASPRECGPDPDGTLLDCRESGCP